MLTLLHVAAAACLQVLEAMAATKPDVAAAEVQKVAGRFRARHFCDRVLAACQAAGGPGTAGPI